MSRSRSRARGARRLLAGALTLLLATQLDAALESIRVYPPDVSLTTSRDRQSIVVQAVYDDGLTRDVTAESELSLLTEGVARLEGVTLYPIADGETRLRVVHGERSAELVVKVEKATEDRPISFRLDVMPVFTKSGCNTGSCHGAARGKDGFRLSLFGYDPAGDHFRLTRELNGRRVNLALLHDSLFLEKAAGRVSHTGGKLLDESGELYETLVRWLDAHAPDDPKDIPSPTGLELYPPNAVLDGEGASQQLTVRASYSDGTTRDVTSLAFFLSNNDTSARISQEGLVTAGDRGEAFLMARFATFTVGAHFIVLPKALEFKFPEIAPHNYIDELVHAKLRRLRIAPSELCSDEAFLRRAYLDIVGLLPTPEEHARFTADTSTDKRERLVDELLERKEFVEIWVMKWAELLQIRSTQNVSYKATLLYYNWLRERLASNTPMNVMVRELLSATGGTFDTPATNYYQNETDTLKVSENVAQVFMGMRIQCAQCHNHPFDRWTQDDYYAFAAFFAQIGRKRGEDPRETIVFDARGGEVRHAVDKRVMAPKFLGGETPDLAGRDRREVLATWLASPENPYFATNLANIVWSHFLGRGIIDEVDDVRVSNPPVNQELLDALGRRFTEYNYDFRRLVRDICTSRTYQLSTRANESNAKDTRNFARAAIRRMRAEVLLDCVSQVTQESDKFRGLPRGARAVQIADGKTSNYFLTTFGRAERETVCSCEVRMEPNLSQALHLLNGDTVTQKIRSGGIVRQLLKDQVPTEQILEQLWVRTLTRRPDADEVRAVLEKIEKVENRTEALEDVLWSLLNSREFIFNH